MNQSTKIQILEHGVVYHKPADNPFHYSAWPSVAKGEGGELMVSFSGNRIRHICPFGKVLMVRSRDEGKTWSVPSIVLDTPFDDRDAGLLSMGGGKMCLSSFNITAHEIVTCYKGFVEELPKDEQIVFEHMAEVAPHSIRGNYPDSLLMFSEDYGYTWKEPIRVPISAPHGPVLTSDGTLLYLGTIVEGHTADAVSVEEDGMAPIALYKINEDGSFEKISQVPACPEMPATAFYNEPHMIELPDGRLLAHIRMDGREGVSPADGGLFTSLQTISEDGGRTWSVPKELGCIGAPPFLFRHSSGALISVYGRRMEPFGISVMISWDDGETWEKDIPLWSGQKDLDLGYPGLVEMDNGDLFTVYYGKLPDEDHCSILYTRWRLG